METTEPKFSMNETSSKKTTIQTSDTDSRKRGAVFGKKIESSNNLDGPARVSARLQYRGNSPELQITDYATKTFLTEGKNLGEYQKGPENKEYQEAITKYERTRNNNRTIITSSGSVKLENASCEISSTKSRFEHAKQLDSSLHERPYSSISNATNRTDFEGRVVDESNLPLMMRKLKMARASKQNQCSDDRTSDMTRILAMTKIARAVKTMHLNRQQKLVATGNITAKNELRKFLPGLARDVIFEILESTLRDMKYDEKTCAALSKTLCETIKNEMKILKFPRYKFVSTVIVGQRADQCINSASRCIWNTGTDDYACSEYSNSSLFASAVVFAIFQE